MLERITSPRKVWLVGDFEIIARDDGFTLSNLGTAIERSGRLGSITLKSQTLARDVAQVLSLSFVDGVSSGSIAFRLGDLGFAEVSGGKLGSCRLFRWDKKRQKEEGKPFFTAKSYAELEDGLLDFLTENSGN